MQITVKPSIGTTAGKKYPTLFEMVRYDQAENWVGNICTITRTKTIAWAQIKDDLSADKMIDGKDILSVEA